MTDNDQDLVASVLASTPPPEVSADFVARVNARIDETAGWSGLADFRVWTLRLAPAAAVLALLAVLWPDASVEHAVTAPAASTASFTPASAADWQQDISSDALLAAALTGGRDAR